MATRINDNRIGVRDSKNKVTQYPTHFANGGFWSRIGNPTPTTCYFGKDQRYFYVLPIGMAALDPDSRKELEAITNAADAPVVTPEPVVALPPKPTANQPVQLVPTNVEPEDEPTDSLVNDSADGFNQPQHGINLEADHLIPEPKKKPVKKSTVEKDSE